MVLNDIKTYLQGRIGTAQILALSDAELTKYFNTALSILNAFYYFDQSDNEELKIKIAGEEIVFIFKCDIDFNPYYQYNGLTSFNIAGAIAGSVSQKTGNLFPAFLKALIADAEIQEKTTDAFSTVKTSFTWN